MLTGMGIMTSEAKLFFHKSQALKAMSSVAWIILLILSACTDTDSNVVGDQEKQLQADIVAVQASPEKLSFNRDIKPVLENRCVVCHGCFDAPCQLKLSAIEGVTRGASKIKVYNKKRFEWQQPTRLFIDANTTEQWRDMGFTSVLSEQGTQSAEENLKHSVLYKMLNLKQV